MNQFSLFIHLDQLDVLGVNEKHRTLLGLLLATIVIFLIVKLIVTILTKRNYTLLLTYVIVSLIGITTSLTIAYDEHNREIVSLTILVMAIFGICLIIFRLYEKMKQFMQRKLMRTPKRHY